MLTRTRTCTCACGRLRDYTGDGGEEEGQGRKKSEKSCFRRSREARGWRNHVLSVRGVCLSGSRGLLQTQAPRTGSGASAAPPQPSPAHTPHPHAPKGACHSLRAHLHLHRVLSIQDPELPSPNGPNPRPRVCGGPLPRSVDRVTGGTLLGQGVAEEQPSPGAAGRASPCHLGAHLARKAFGTRPQTKTGREGVSSLISVTFR